VGGSGTRLVATFLRNLDFYIGSDLNSANDNLWFTLLLARPRWFARSSEGEITQGISIFEKAMMGRLSLGKRELDFIVQSAIGLSLREYLHWGPSPLKQAIKRIWPARVILEMNWALKRAATMHLSNGIGNATRWGWKEPCTYIYLEHLARFFDNLKYIHVIRHGLDMAYSHNQGHLYGWGYLFDVEARDRPEYSPTGSLDYWIESNLTTINLGKKILGDRFLVVNFDELCSSPRAEVEKLVDFLKPSTDQVDIDELCDLCRIPRSTGRYRQHDLSVFGERRIDAVRKLGFVVQPAGLTNGG
jgi:hypothetical protein